jgi:hypothetical protein
MHVHVRLRCCPPLNLRSVVPIRIQIGQYPFTSMKEVTSLVLLVLFNCLCLSGWHNCLFVSIFRFFDRMVSEGQYSSSLKCSPAYMHLTPLLLWSRAIAGTWLTLFLQVHSRGQFGRSYSSSHWSSGDCVIFCSSGIFRWQCHLHNQKIINCSHRQTHQLRPHLSNLIPD